MLDARQVVPDVVQAGGAREQRARVVAQGVEEDVVDAFGQGEAYCLINQYDASVQKAEVLQPPGDSRAEALRAPLRYHQNSVVTHSCYLVTLKVFAKESIVFKSSQTRGTTFVCFNTYLGDDVQLVCTYFDAEGSAGATTNTTNTMRILWRLLLDPALIDA